MVLLTPFLIHFFVVWEMKVMVASYRVVHESILHRLTPSAIPVRTFMMNSIDDNVLISEKTPFMALYASFFSHFYKW